MDTHGLSTYVFEWNGKKRLIIALNIHRAFQVFEREYGFHPADINFYKLES